MTVRRLSALAIGVFLVSALAWLVVIPRLQPHTFNGVVMQSLTEAPAIDLRSTSGELVSLDSFKGKLVVVYFGYTHCPDVCPTTLSTLNRALDRMGDRSDDVQVVMVTVDPERDTVDLLAEYMSYFNETFIGLTGSVEDVAKVATTYGVYFAANDGDADSGYTVDHTAHLMVIDRAGHLRLVLPPELGPEEIASDLEYLS
ncbi:MAG: SCO family protein [Acidimicrobiia bacterium]|nr:SCO family protein [Acidimicrobiia bacterium]